MFFWKRRKLVFHINEDSIPYKRKYMRNKDYEQRKYYYLFRSYMEQLERRGGGVIEVEQGTYPLTNNICIPSDVELNLADGVVFKKEGTAKRDICYAKSLFTIVPPSIERKRKKVRGYRGSKNVSIIGNGTVFLDCNNVKNCMAIAMGGAQNVKIQGISFVNGYGAHFIELNSSCDVLVEHCSFGNFQLVGKKSYKECINVDGNDGVTNGFNFDWSAHDRTVCKNIVIRNNSFSHVGTAIGSHTYSCVMGRQLYHENVQILGNIVDGTYNSFVKAMNWKDCVIENNVFRNLQILSDGKLKKNGRPVRYPGLKLMGVVNPHIMGNTFDTLHYYPIRIVQEHSPWTTGGREAGYPPTVCEISEEKMRDMRNNTILNLTNEKYLKIVLRREDSQTDSSADKINMLKEG